MGYLLQNGGLGMAGDWIITGGRPLQGRVEVPAAKNSVLPLLAAALLCSGPVRLQNVPRLTDVEDCLALLQGVGCTAGWQGTELVVQGQPMRTDLAPEAAGRMRASILFCAPLLARLGRVSTVLPGGCRIGARPIDLHLQGLAQMGVRQLPTAPGQLTLYTPAGLRGAEICLSFPSVGATETLLLAAATAQGQTVLHGVAKDPEIVDLAAFLNACGGCVEGAGTDTIRVQGKRCLAGCTFAPVADRIIASTLACAAAAAGGRVELAGCAPGLYAPLLEILEQMGCTVERARDAAAISRFGALRGAGNVHTAPYPGLATDAAPLLAAVMLCAQGESCLQDRVFEHRFACADGFAALGANVRVAERTLYVQPGGALRGAKLTAPDLRGGAALVLAALAARGSSRLGGVEFVRRGYADLDRLLAGLGAQIWQEIPARSGVMKKHPRKSNFVLQSERKNDTILLYKYRMIISVRLLRSST